MQEDVEKLENCEEFAVQKLREPKQLRINELSIGEEESKSTVNQLMVQIQDEFTERCQRLSMILKRQAVLGYPTFPVSLFVFRVHEVSLAAILSCSLTHGTHLVQQDTFFEDLSAPGEPSSALFCKYEEFSISFLRICTCGYRKNCWASWCIGKRP